MKAKLRREISDTSKIRTVCQMPRVSAQQYFVLGWGCGFPDFYSTTTGGMGAKRRV